MFRIIDEIPEELFEWIKLKGQMEDEYGNGGNFEFGSQYRQRPRFEQPKDSYDEGIYQYQDDSDVVYQIKSDRASVVKSKFPKGTKIRHALYGDGKVEDTEGSGNDEKVTIKFLDGNRKKFMVKFAPLTEI